MTDSNPKSTCPTCGWIRVQERLPEDRQMCLVWDGDPASNPTVARYVGGRQFHDFFKNWVKVTHWMSLPAPPSFDEADHENPEKEPQ